MNKLFMILGLACLCVGAAAGFRYFFLPNAGITAQVAYHRIGGWDFPNLWDVRLGATFRF
jgi:hypothetical protein